MILKSFKPGFIIKNLIRLFYLFSIDVALGALAVYVFACSVFDSPPDPAIMFLIFVGVILIYATDHILDGYRKKGKSFSEEHHFFFNKRQSILFVMIILSILSAACSLFFLSHEKLFKGLMLMALISLYLVSNYFFSARRLFIKEFWISSLYCICLWYFPYLDRNSDPDFSTSLVFAAFYLVILMNVLIFSYFNQESDKQENESNIFLSWPGIDPHKTIWLAGIASFIISLYLLFGLNDSKYSMQAIVLILMNVGMLQILIFRNYYSRSDRFARMADALILLGFLSILFPF